MIKNYGKLHSGPVEIPALMMFKVNEDDPDVMVLPPRTFYKAFAADGEAWNDICARMQLGPDDWFIAVQDDGWILMAERDPTMMMISGHDIWRISHPGPDTAIRTHKWTGKEVEPWPVSPAP